MRWVLGGSFAASFVLVAALSRAAQGAHELVNEDYRFRLAVPGADWSLLDTPEARQIAPDALAFVKHPRNVFALVIVEYAGQNTLADVAAMARSNIRLEECVDEGRAEVRFCERPALRVQFSGRASGLSLRYVDTFFQNGDYVYQYVCWGVTDVVDAEAKALEPLLDVFTLLDGAPRPRAVQHVNADARGVGWCLRDGRFRSATFGLCVEAPAPWRVVVGSELHRMNASAEVGLECDAPDMYVAVIPERMAGALAGDLAAKVRLDFAAAREAVGEPFRARIGGAECELRALRAEAPGILFVHTAFARDGCCYQVLSWFLGELDETRRERLESAWRSLRFLGAGERAALERELDALPDPESQVGADFSLRGGVYRDYGAALAWRKPPGWRVHAGADARAEGGETTRLTLEQPELGVLGSLYVAPSEADSAEEHAQAVAAFLPAGQVHRRTRTLGERAALESSLVVGSDVGKLGYRLLTAQAGGRSYCLLLHGFSANLEAARQPLERALDAFQLDAELDEPDVYAGVYRDEKLGFALASPGAGWRVRTDLVPGGVAERAGSCGWSNGLGGEVFVIAIGILDTGSDERALEQLMLGGFAERMRGEHEEFEGTFEGLPARCRTFRNAKLTTDIRLVRRDNTLFCLGLCRIADAASMADAERWFEFLP